MSSRCICKFPSDCNGTGGLSCRRCGGDFCACAACYGQGEMECPGCVYCASMEDEDAVWMSQEEAEELFEEGQP